jgi:hypothetical protein
MIEYETDIPTKQLKEWRYSNYSEHVSWLNRGRKTLNWACPKCGRILVQQRGGLSYNQPELKNMIKRLQVNSWNNLKYLREHKKDVANA